MLVGRSTDIVRYLSEGANSLILLDPESVQNAQGNEKFSAAGEAKSAEQALDRALDDFFAANSDVLPHKFTAPTSKQATTTSVLDPSRKIGQTARTSLWPLPGCQEGVPPSVFLAAKKSSMALCSRADAHATLGFFIRREGYLGWSRAAFLMVELPARIRPTRWRNVWAQVFSQRNNGWSFRQWGKLPSPS
jgi:hypothetical protein